MLRFVKLIFLHLHLLMKKQTLLYVSLSTEGSLGVLSNQGASQGLQIPVNLPLPSCSL